MKSHVDIATFSYKIKFFQGSNINQTFYFSLLAATENLDLNQEKIYDEHTNKKGLGE